MRFSAKLCHRVSWRSLALLASVFSLLIAPAPSIAFQETDKPCQKHPQLVGQCFTVHGRLAVYNGAPALRILKIGTRRMLGVSEQRFAVPGYRNIPQEVQEKLDQDKYLLGDYRVCPFTKPKKNEMQLVCIESVSNLVVKVR